MSKDVTRALPQPMDWTEYRSVIHDGLNEWTAGHVETDITGYDLNDPEIYRRLLNFMATTPTNAEPVLNARLAEDYPLCAAIKWLQRTPSNLCFIYGTHTAYMPEHSHTNERLYECFRRFLREDFEIRQGEMFKLSKLYYMGYWQGLQQKLVAGTSLGLLYWATQVNLLPDTLMRADFVKLFN